MRAKKRSEYKMAIRNQAKKKVQASKYDLNSSSGYRDQVEQGLNTLRRASAEGGDGTAKRVKSELTYLLNNYLPRYDMRIEQLIDEWRRSGDPSYNPGIRSKLRQARREHMSKSNSV